MTTPRTDSMTTDPAAFGLDHATSKPPDSTAKPEAPTGPRHRPDGAKGWGRHRTGTFR